MTNLSFVCANCRSTSHLWWIGKLSLTFIVLVKSIIVVKLGKPGVSAIDLWTLFSTCCQNYTACWRHTAWSVCWAVRMSSLKFSCTSRPRALPRWWPTGLCMFQCSCNEVTSGMKARRVLSVPQYDSIWSSVLGYDYYFIYSCYLIRIHASWL